MADAPRLLTPEDVQALLRERDAVITSLHERQEVIDRLIVSVERLDREKKRYQDGWVRANESLDAIRKERDELKSAMKISAALIEHVSDERDAARAALQEYGAHRLGCPQAPEGTYVIGSDFRMRPCSCGLDTTLEENTMAETTLGEQRVRTDFNVAGDLQVDTIKHKTAELINLCEGLKAKDPRLAALAQTAYEEAAMWAVKAATA